VVALRVAAWLDQAGARTVVDVGSGAGKFCVAAALASRCSFTGIEQRPRFVEQARALACLFRVDDRVRFLQGDLNGGQLPAADAYYLYNPFGENLYDADEHLGDDVELSLARYRRDIALMQRFFERAPIGTLVVKYNGFGGRMPPSYEDILVDREMPNVLRMWRKRSATSVRRRCGEP
jgi:predicted RNA methylase